MLKKIQAATGVIFAVFVLIHLANTYLAGFGPAAYDTVQGALRTVYQFPPVEVLLLAALAVHVVVGVMRIVQEPKRTLSARARWHRYAGFFMMVFIVGHILAVRGSSWFFDIYPGFEGLAFSLEYVPAYFYPYYFLLGMAGFYHALNGLSIALPRLGLSFRVSSPTLRAGSVAAAAFLGVALLSLGGVLYELGDLSDNPFGRLAMEISGVGTP